MSYDSRLNVIAEQLPGPTEITLIMADGSRKIIWLPGGRDACDLYVWLLHHPHSEEASAVRNSVAAIEPGGGHLMEIARAALIARDETAEAR